MTARASGSSSPAALLNPVKPPRGHHLDPPTPGLVPGGEPGPEDLPGPARGHVQQTRRPRLVACGGQVDDHRGRTCRPAWCGVTPRGHLPHGSEARGGIVDSEDLHTVEAVRLAGDGLLGLAQDCVVGGGPGDPQSGCYPTDRHALQGKGTQPPLDHQAGQPHPRLGQPRRVLSPHSAAVGAGEAPHAYQQLRGSPSHRYVGQASGHRPTSLPLGPAERVLNPIGMRHSTMALAGVRCRPTAVRPRASSPRKVVRSGPVKIVSGTSRSLVTGCVAAPIIGGPRPLPAATTPPSSMHFNRPRLLHPQTRRTTLTHIRIVGTRRRRLVRPSRMGRRGSRPRTNARAARSIRRRRATARPD